MKNKIFITGATGFIGASITRKLVSDNHEVSILIRNGKLNWRLQDIQEKLQIIKGDLLEESLESKIKKINPEYVFHCAAYGSLPSEGSSDMLIDINIKGTI